MDRIVDQERAALLALLEERPALAGERTGSTTWPAIASEVSLRGSALALWRATRPTEPLTLDIGDHPGSDRRIDIAWRTVEDWAQASDFSMITVLDEDYPFALREIHQMPPVLFVRGDLPPDEVGISIVGSRAATERGRSIAARVAEELVERGIAVISGLAAGIDAAAHEATLRAGGRPIGVLGTGVRRVYPAHHAQLHDDVAAAGALVSQFLPDAAPTKQSFPMRNVTMSGLGRATIILEAGEHSGTRIQARAAIDHGRPVILTDTVVDQTSWGRDLADRPGVHVAGGITELLDIVDQILADDRSDTLEVLPAELSDLP